MKQKYYALMHKPLCLGWGDATPVIIKDFYTVKEARKYCKDNNITGLFHYIVCTKVFSINKG